MTRAMIGTAVLLAGLNTGCSSMSNTEKGALGGGAIGAGVGTLIGAATHNPKTGAVVGGLLGAGVGGAVGNDMDRADKEKQQDRDAAVAVAQAQASQPANPPLGMIDVVQMVQQGQSADVIINQIHNTHSTFQLSTTDLQYLKANNVPDAVIVAMQNARPKAVVVAPRPRTVVVREPAPVVYGDPYYYGPGPGYYYPRPAAGVFVRVR